jgi:hypothetical protein
MGKLKPMMLLCAMLLSLGVARADTITDTTLNVRYTLTSDFVNQGTVANPTYDVTLVVQTSSFTGAGGATSGYLQAFAPQFQLAGGGTASSVTILSASSGTWTTPLAPGSTNSSGCMLGGAEAGFFCSQNTSATGGAVPGTLTFVLGVSVPTGTTLSTDSDIKAVYNSTPSGSGTFLGQTSQDIRIQTPTTRVPESSSLSMLGFGLLGLAALRKLKTYRSAY